MLIGCGHLKIEEPITNKDESTIIKDVKNTDEYLRKEDYKTIAYSYIYNIKEGLKSYESETNGSVKAKIAFFNYDIKYHTVTFKNGSTFYSKDNSTSALMNIQNEFYMVNNEKILVSRDLKKYNVYTIDDYHKVSYTPNQYMIMGYVFNDESIVKSELVSSKDDIVSVKYTLDNEKATHWVKVDLKENGGLANYPEFKNIEMTLTMKKDFTPVSYAINAVYNASKPIIGSSEVTQEGECVFSKINETITIPNEAFLINELGAKPSEIDTDQTEENIKNELLASLEKLDIAHGVNVNGALTLNILGQSLVLTIDGSAAFDVSKLSKEKLYKVLDLYAQLEGDENLGLLLGLVSTFAGSALGPYASILEGFKKVEAIYDEEGSIYLVPTNIEEKHATIAKIKLVDIVDLILKNVNVVGAAQTNIPDLFSFKKIEGKDKDSFDVEITLNSEIINNIKSAIDKFFENSTYAMIKTMLNYKDFNSLKIKVAVANGMFSKVDASFNILQGGTEGGADTVNPLVTLHLDFANKAYDFASKIAYANDLYKDLNSVQELKGRIAELVKNVYVNKAYLANVEKALADYEALTDVQKGFLERNAKSDLESAKRNVADILAFLEVCNKYDLNHLTNEDILVLAEAYRKNVLSSKLLSGELGEDKYAIVSDLSKAVDYSSFESALSKIEGDDEKAWGLTVDEIKGIKLLFDISKVESGVKDQIMLRLLFGGKTISADDLEAKINSLYSGIINN